MIGPISTKQPLVSVMMPARNTEKYITEAIQSIINQTYKNWELIILDDKSTDNTKVIAEKFANTDSRIKVYDGEGIGTAAARNKIIDLSIGKYIMLMDSDDVSVPERMEKLVNVAEQHNTCFVGSNLYFVDTKLKILRTSNMPLENREIRAGFLRIINRETIIPGTVLAHRSIYVKHRYNEFYHSMEDWDLILRISEDPSVNFANIAEPLYLYRLNEGSATLNPKKRIKYNLLLRYNEINRRKNKEEIKSMVEFEEKIHNSIMFCIIYNFFYTLKKIQHILKFRKL